MHVVLPLNTGKGCDCHLAAAWAAAWVRGASALCVGFQQAFRLDVAVGFVFDLLLLVSDLIAACLICSISYLYYRIVNPLTLYVE